MVSIAKSGESAQISNHSTIEYEPVINLSLAGFRYYDANTGRFSNEDPIGFNGGDANLFRYVGNGPVSNTDPMGLWMGVAEALPSGGGSVGYYPPNPGRPNERGNWPSPGNKTCCGGGASLLPKQIQDVVANTTVFPFWHNRCVKFTENLGENLDKSGYKPNLRGIWWRTIWIDNPNGPGGHNVTIFYSGDTVVAAVENVMYHRHGRFFDPTAPSNDSIHEALRKQLEEEQKSKNPTCHKGCQ